MTPGIRPLVAGNWKMNGTAPSLDELSRLANGYTAASGAEVIICVPHTLIYRAAERMKTTEINIGGQDCHAKESGAHTGDVSAEMLKDAGAACVIVGHSERRADHQETSRDVQAKASAAWRAGLTAIICIGETGEEREGGETLDVLSRQLKGSVPPGATSHTVIIAYEPVWAIGTGKTPSVEDIEKAHAHIRSELAAISPGEAEKIRILYGGSVKSTNAAEILGIENVDGALVGGASLKASDLLPIIEAYERL